MTYQAIARKQNKTNRRIINPVFYQNP